MQPVILGNWKFNPSAALYQSAWNGTVPHNAIYHGALVDIAGTGFGIRPTFAFAGGVDGRIETTPIGADSTDSGGFYLSDGRPKSVEIDAQRGKVWKSTVWDGNLGTADNGLIYHDWGSQIPSGSKVYVHFLNKTNCNASIFQWKQYRCESTYNYSDGGPEIVMFGWQDDTGKQIFIRPNSDTSEPVSIYANDLSMNPLNSPAWVSYDFYDQLSDEGVANGVSTYTSIANGINYTLYDSNSVKHFGTGISGRRRYHILQNLLTSYNAEAPTVGDVWVDDFYVQVSPPSNDLVRVYICNSAMYENATIREIQTPAEGWNNTNAQIKINRGAIPNGQCWLIVIANKNTQLAAVECNLTGV